MFYCDSCKVESINAGYTKPCKSGSWIYKADGGKCDRCHKPADVFNRPEMACFALNHPIKVIKEAQPEHGAWGKQFIAVCPNCGKECQGSLRLEA